MATNLQSISPGLFPPNTLAPAPSHFLTANDLIRWCANWFYLLWLILVRKGFYFYMCVKITFFLWFHLFVVFLPSTWLRCYCSWLLYYFYTFLFVRNNNFMKFLLLNSGGDLLLVSVVSAVHKIVDSLISFLSPYLDQLLQQLCVLSARCAQLSDNPKLQPVLQKIKLIRLEFKEYL